MEIEEIVETVEGVLVKMVAARAGGSMGVTTVVEERTCNEVEGTVGKRDGDDAETETDTIAVGIREGDEDKKEMIDGSTTSGERDGDGAETETDTIAVGVREGDEDEKVIDGDTLEGLSSVVLSRLGS